MSNVCEILSVGTELLLGDIVNTDTAFIAGRLASLGLPTYRQTVVATMTVVSMKQSVRRSPVPIFSF